MTPLGRGVGTVGGSLEEVSLAELAKECVTAMKERVAAGGIRVDIAPDLPTVIGDRGRLLELLRNLTENAVKFSSEQSEPRIEIGVRRDLEQTVCYVADNGCGIEKNNHERVFGLFERLDGSREGTGLGLAIVKRIAEIHGGRAWVESEGDGKGSTFCFSLAKESVVDGSREVIKDQS